jgi:hypothetical protein
MVGDMIVLLFAVVFYSTIPMAFFAEGEIVWGLIFLLAIPGLLFARVVLQIPEALSRARVK